MGWHVKKRHRKLSPDDASRGRQAAATGMDSGLCETQAVPQLGPEGLGNTVLSGPPLPHLHTLTI